MSERLEFVHTKLVKDAWLSPPVYINSPSDAVLAIRDMIGELDKEVCAVVNLSTRGQVINASFVSMGSINSSLVTPPQVFRASLLSGATSVLVMHNHPSGNCTPSNVDRLAAGKLAAAGRIVGVELTDFLILTDTEMYSFKEWEPASLDPETEMLPDLAAAEAEAFAEGRSAYNAYDRLKQDRRALVDSILDKIRSGDAFSSPMWSRHAVSPRNPLSGAFYQGGNRLILMNRTIDAGYRDPRWMTYNQLSQKGYSLKTGSHGTMLEKWVFSKRVKEKDAAGNTVTKEVMLERPFPYYFTVFNAEQVEGFPAFDGNAALYHPKAGEGTQEIINALIKSSECPIHETAQERSFYRPSTDEIFLPPRGVFRSLEAFGHVACHEMVHSTGHESRLMRTFGHADPFSGPDENYCVEELRAEIGSLFLTSDLGLFDEDFDITNSASYVQHYMEQMEKAIDRDPNILFRAASDAEKACSFLRTRLEKTLPLEKTKEEIPDYADIKKDDQKDKAGPPPSEAAFSL